MTERQHLTEVQQCVLRAFLDLVLEYDRDEQDLIRDTCAEIFAGGERRAYEAAAGMRASDLDHRALEHEAVRGFTEVLRHVKYDRDDDAPQGCWPS